MVPGTVGGQFRRWGRSTSEHQESFQKNSEVGCAGAARRQGVSCGPSVGQHSTHSRAIGEPSQKSDGGLVRFCKFVHQASAFPYLITVPVHDEARIITKNVTINGSPKDKCAARTQDDPLGRCGLRVINWRAAAGLLPDAAPDARRVGASGATPFFPTVL